jgi:hypothetical protein
MTKYTDTLDALYPDATVLTETVDRNGKVVTTGIAVALMTAHPEVSLTEATIVVREWLATKPQVLNE